jgi:hypothetical protein
MRRHVWIFVVAVAVLMLSCHKEPVPSSLVFATDDIVVDLGATDADVLQYVSASDGAEVTVQGIDYNLVGKQEAVFTAGNVSEKRSVKVRANRLAGRYSFMASILDIDGLYYPLTGEGWYWDFALGNTYNQIIIPDSAYCPYSYRMEHLFEDQGGLTMTLEGESRSITPWRGKLYFNVSYIKKDFEFDSIQYARQSNGEYAITSFLMIDTYNGKHNYYKFEFEKQFDSK